MGVTVSAIVKRINRKLAADYEKLRASRGARAEMDLGRFFIINVNRNFIVEKHVDVEELARRLNVLADWESVVESVNRS